MLNHFFKLTLFLFYIVISTTFMVSAAVEVASNERLRNGEPCKGIGGNNSQCSSGYCLPGPARICRSDVLTGYCTHRDFNCARSGELGGMYNETIQVGKEALTCQNPGRGRWAQFCSIK